MAAKGMINLDRINGHIYSLVHTADLENGMICNLGSLSTGEREIYEVATPATASLATAEIIIIATPELMYDETKNVEDFYIAAGDVARGVSPVVGDIFTVSKGIMTGTPAVGKYLIAANGSLKLTVADTLGTERFAAEIIEKTTLGYTAEEAYTFRVLKN